MSDHDITRRDLSFDFSGVDLLRWHPKGTQSSHYFNVQSLLFPQGERFFIRSVRHFRDRIDDPRLQEQIAGFIAQEAMHGREHDAYNAALGRAGYRVEQMERWVGRVMWLTEKTMPPLGRLAMTAALEHLTAIGAEDALRDDRILEGADPQMARLWRWHALEELEHKTVAFDVYRTVAGNGLLAWLRLCWAMLNASIGMTLMTWVFLVGTSVRTGTVFQWRDWGRLFYGLWVVPGGLRLQFFRYWRFFKPGFHPSQIDNRRELERWRPAYDLSR